MTDSDPLRTLSGVDIRTKEWSNGKRDVDVELHPHWTKVITDEETDSPYKQWIPNTNIEYIVERRWPEDHEYDP